MEKSHTTAQWKRDQIANGLCQHCKDKAVRSGFCQKHYAMNAKRQKEYRDKRKSRGLCRRCDKPRAPGSEAMCETHLEEFRAYQNKRNAAIRDVRTNGIDFED